MDVEFQSPWIIVEIYNSYVFLVESIIKTSSIFFIEQPDLQNVPKLPVAEFQKLPTL